MNSPRLTLPEHRDILRSFPILSQTQKIQAAIQACAEGRPEGLTHLYETLAPRLYSMLLRILRRKDVAEEALQEGFLKLWKNAASYETRESSPMAWIVSIFRHQAFDSLRRGKHEKLSDFNAAEHFLASDHQAPWEELVQSREAQALKKCLEQLEEGPRDSIVLAYWKGLTQEELAERQQKPLGTIKAWIRRGLEKLRNCLSYES